VGYHLSRQRSYDDNCLYLEIACNKKDIGVDVLTPRYRGEGKTYVSPVDAVRIAHEIYNSWEKDYGDEKKRLKIVGLASQLVYECTQKGFDAAKQWAERILSNMKKCGNTACGKPLGNKPPYEHNDLPNTVFCGEMCLASKYRDTFGIEAPRVILKDKTKGILKI